MWDFLKINRKQMFSIMKGHVQLFIINIVQQDLCNLTVALNIDETKLMIDLKCKIRGIKSTIYHHISTLWDWASSSLKKFWNSNWHLTLSLTHLTWSGEKLELIFFFNLWIRSAFPLRAKRDFFLPFFCNHLPFTLVFAWT